MIATLFDALGTTYLTGIQDPATYQIKLIIPEIHEHLFNNHGDVTWEELQELQVQLENLTYQPTEPKTRKCKSDLNAWNHRTPATNIWADFKTEMGDAHTSSRHTSELTVQDAIYHVNIVNMVAKGIQQAMKNPPTMIFNEY
eukprot:4453643-Ditylum_brightwellii.AAC.2